MRTTKREQGRPDNTRWTGAKAGDFLKLLARTGKVAPAARAVGMSARSAYRLRRRAPQFAQLWDVAMAEAKRRKASSRQKRRVHPLLAKGPYDNARAVNGDMRGDARGDRGDYA